MNLPLIGFTGPAGAGKSTAAKALVEILGFKRISFADPLRAMLMGIGLTTEDTTIRKNEPIAWLDGKTARQLLQTLGTEWGRQIVHPEIWIRHAEQRIDYFKTTRVPGIVFDDVRFDNEAQMIRDAGGFVIRIRRNVGELMTHASEKGVNPTLVHASIGNDGDVKEMTRVAVSFVKTLTRQEAA